MFKKTEEKEKDTSEPTTIPANVPPAAPEPTVEELTKVKENLEAEVARLRAEPVADLVGLRRDIARRLKAEGIPVAGYPWP